MHAILRVGGGLTEAQFAAQSRTVAIHSDEWHFPLVADALIKVDLFKVTLIVGFLVSCAMSLVWNQRGAVWSFALGPAAALGLWLLVVVGSLWETGFDWKASSFAIGMGLVLVLGGGSLCWVLAALFGSLLGMAGNALAKWIWRSAMGAMPHH